MIHSEKWFAKNQVSRITRRAKKCYTTIHFSTYDKVSQKNEGYHLEKGKKGKEEGREKEKLFF